MGNFKDTSVEITYKGKQYRVAKSDAHKFAIIEPKPIVESPIIKKPKVVKPKK